MMSHAYFTLYNYFDLVVYRSNSILAFLSDEIKNSFAATTHIDRIIAFIGIFIQYELRT